MKGLEEHKYLLEGRTLLGCPFCGGEPFIDSCDSLINIGCEHCKFHLYFHGFVQSEIETKVVASRSSNTGEPLERYDKDAYQKAVIGWNRRIK